MMLRETPQLFGIKTKFHFIAPSIISVCVSMFSFLYSWGPGKSPASWGPPGLWGPKCPGAFSSYHLCLNVTEQIKQQ